MSESPSRATLLIQQISEGNRQAASELLPLVYDELRGLARARLARERPGQTLQPTALVHEAYLRLVEGADPGWDGKRHFFAAAAEAMRRILIERARRRAAEKHGGDAQRVTLDRLIVEPSAEIDRQFTGRAVAAVAIAIDGLGDDPGEIAAQNAKQLVGGNRSMFGDGVLPCGVGGEKTPRRRRRVVARDPLDRGEQRSAAEVEGRRPQASS